MENAADSAFLSLLLSVPVIVSYIILPKSISTLSVRTTLQLRPLWMPVIVSRRSPRPVRRGKGELGTTSPGQSLHPGQAKPGRLGVVSGPR